LNGFGRVGLLDVLADQDLGDLDVGIARVAEDGVELALGRLPRHLGKARDDGDGGLPIFSGGSPFGRFLQHDGPAHAGVVRLEPHRLAAAPQDARHAVVGALGDLQDLSFRAPARSSEQPRRHRVAVHRAGHPILGDVKIIFEARARDEPEPARMNAEESLPLGLAAWRGLSSRAKPAGLPGRTVIHGQAILQSGRAGSSAV